MKRISRLICAVIACMLAAVPALSENSANEQALYALVTQDRQAAGLSAITLDAELCRIARIKAQDMLSEGYFAHTSPTYGDIRAMLTSFGYSYAGAAENIARSRSVTHAQAQFMSSSTGHRQTLLGSQWTRMGIGVVENEQGFVYVVQIFAR